MRQFSFILDKEEYQKDLEFNHLHQMAEDIGNDLFSTGDVDFEKFKNFVLVQNID